jgi:tRNA-splicing ligase RtcB (3'-phosphate/5'-hydroxy nucleic acid ligase)
MPIQYREKQNNIDINVWAALDRVETKAIEQLRNAARLPFVHKCVCAMPDCHVGKGAVIGSVIPTKGAVIPAAVGVDIGCGMMAVKLEMPAAIAMDNAKKLRHSIERSIPLGKHNNSQISDSVTNWAGWNSFESLSVNNGNLKRTATSQLGSLGGGNHFVELCADTEGSLWVMLHSGSRGVGASLAEFHINRAKSELARLATEIHDPDLAWFVQHTPEFDAYWADLQWCQNYAAQNRHEMMDRVLHCLSYDIAKCEPLKVAMSVNCHHNYATMETHFDEELIVTRKGAVRAGKGELGIIPGSMGQKSYIVRGLGNPESLESCSHGAGRKMSRTAARQAFGVADLEAQTAGVECRKDSGVVDEIPAAYKDIDQVMRDQSDLVEVVAELKQFVCIKG